MPQLRRIAALAAALALAAPSGALAQGAGETQYSDPFEGQESSTGGGGGNANANAGSGSSGSGTGGGGGELTTRPPSNGGGPSESEATETRTPRGELPRTGADPGLVALLGAGLILTGAGLRVRVRPPLA